MRRVIERRERLADVDTADIAARVRASSEFLIRQEQRPEVT
jgi:hypothetical protein